MNNEHPRCNVLSFSTPLLTFIFITLLQGMAEMLFLACGKLRISVGTSPNLRYAHSAIPPEAALATKT
jgi:hypothetical protein